VINTGTGVALVTGSNAPYVAAKAALVTAGAPGTDTVNYTPFMQPQAAYSGAFSGMPAALGVNPYLGTKNVQIVQTADGWFAQFNGERIIPVSGQALSQTDKHSLAQALLRFAPQSLFYIQAGASSFVAALSDLANA
jgi:hypothetical protein